MVFAGIAAFGEAAIALQDELIPEASDEPTPDDLLFQETEEVARALEGDPEEDTHLKDEGRPGDPQGQIRPPPPAARFNDDMSQ